MKVTLATFGGLGAGLPQAPALVDDKDISADKAGELRRLVAAAKSARPSTGDRNFTGGGFTVTVEDETGTTVLRATNLAGARGDDPLEALREWLSKNAQPVGRSR